MSMRTTIEIDDDLMAEALKVSGLKTKRAVVEACLKVLIQRHTPTDIQALRDAVNQEGDYI